MIPSQDRGCELGLDFAGLADGAGHHCSGVHGSAGASGPSAGAATGAHNPVVEGEVIRRQGSHTAAAYEVNNTRKGWIA